MTRRFSPSFVGGIFFLLFASALLPAAASADSTVDSVGMTVNDLDRSVAFYSNVLSFTRYADIHIPELKRRIVRLQLGEDAIELAEPHLTNVGERAYEPLTGEDRFYHLAIQVRNLKQARKHLRRHGVRSVEEGPSWLNRKGIQSIAFADPDGRHLLLVEYPRNRKGLWRHRRSKGLFLGIDHVAIPLVDSNAGLRFYRDGVGLEVDEADAGGNGSGVTMFRPKKGPRIACLEGLVATKPLSKRASEKEPVRWQTRVKTSNLSDAIATLRSEVVYEGTLGVVEEGKLQFKRGAVVRDPDGHAIELIQR